MGIPVGCRAYNTGDLALNASTWYALGFNLERYDTHSFHDVVTNNSRFVIPGGMAGRYRVGGCAELLYDYSGGLFSGYIYLALRMDGATWLAMYTRYPSSSFNEYRFTDLSVERMVQLNVGQYVELCMYHTAPSTRYIADWRGEFARSFWLERLA